MPTAPVEPTKIGESTTEDVPENLGTNPKVPPVVVTFDVTLGIIARDTAAPASEAGRAQAKAEGGSPPRVAASAALSA